MSALENQRCLACEAGIPPLSLEKIQTLLQDVPGWSLNAEGTHIEREYRFKNFYKTMAFVNAIAWIANLENHHPDMKIGYNYCHIALTTHALKALSQNDFILAAKINSLGL